MEEPKEGKIYGPAVYGFSLGTNSGGKPIIREYGNPRNRKIEQDYEGSSELLFEVTENMGRVFVLGELPGIKEEDILIETGRNYVRINVETPTIRLHKEIDLPLSVKTESLATQYRNGVLEIRLEKA